MTCRVTIIYFDSERDKENCSMKSNLCAVCSKIPFLFIYVTIQACLWSHLAPIFLLMSCERAKANGYTMSQRKSLKEVGGVIENCSNLAS